MLEVYFGNNKINDGEYLNLTDISNLNLTLDWNPIPNTYYSVSIKDVLNNNILYMIVNVPENSIEGGDVIYDYIPPSENSQYVIKLYSQDDYLEDFDQNYTRLEESFTFNTETYPKYGKYNVSTHYQKESKDYFKSNHSLKEQEQKYCRCVLHVAAKQTGECLKRAGKIKGGEKINGKTCSNPYAICAKTTRTSSRSCGKSYDFNKIPDNELRAYAAMKGINSPRPYKRNTMINKISQWKKTKYS